ncbi:MAG: tRNA 4-thiouridine(8) synthase ThiI [Candidatus Kerfeldbacteria bacterium CG15_BIG_FIL_POST_REV_8_21_14_020_45_12]|uniref:Probable tRNA sulfurtransferase n=1 Tax=Candidatus Kerfeldbacteria bacterium CG15_BIG_FIL_POST_REV_8_21_14_020_45_12 TaxID=2014247 RepID=A0A2M7H3J9_9BACT|nr:MAG: tRNA 4-thiouridine(8) synthase ThiI [Candidatus Kerfeldbacteria bacterium CG15_BIG_FIL_POST_REV_8_21_14_020_45_12]PJA93071.1 MAG: tRNA 4-thiouridine(8) synthase ThiI [Candidatus Kerfeldbacteria bacterium CG_4_9_14_3_um_filter_45_8]
MRQVVLLNLGELVLKGKNRKVFESQLLRNAKLALSAFDVKFQMRFGRLRVEEAVSGTLADRDQVLVALSQLYGVATIQFAEVLKLDYEAFEKRVCDRVSTDSFESFAVRAKRSDKQFPMTSMELERKLGAAIVKSTGARVDLSNPELEVEVIATEDGLMFVESTYPGGGGLPVGSSGKVLSLISSGIDSPVASSRMMRRGATVHYLHFHSYPMTSRASIDNVKEIVTSLHKHQPPTKLMLAPLLALQQAVVTSAPPSLRIVLYRRAMYQIADRVAGRVRAQALLTGESLGQVASQTMRNLNVTSTGLSHIVFRPLIGMDKEEIIKEAKQLGTYDISIRPYEDCCSLLTPKHVETHADIDEVLAIEAAMPWNELLRAVIKGIEVISIGE